MIKIKSTLGWTFIKQNNSVKIVSRLCFWLRLFWLLIPTSGLGVACFALFKNEMLKILPVPALGIIIVSILMPIIFFTLRIRANKVTYGNRSPVNNRPCDEVEFILEKLENEYRIYLKFKKVNKREFFTQFMPEKGHLIWRDDKKESCDRVLEELQMVCRFYSAFRESHSL